MRCFLHQHQGDHERRAGDDRPRRRNGLDRDRFGRGPLAPPKAANAGPRWNKSEYSSIVIPNRVEESFAVDLTMALRLFALISVSNGHGERSEPSLNRSDDFPAPADARFFVRFL